MGDATLKSLPRTGTQIAHNDAFEGCLTINFRNYFAFNISYSSASQSLDVLKNLINGIAREYLISRALEFYNYDGIIRPFAAEPVRVEKQQIGLLAFSLYT